MKKPRINPEGHELLRQVVKEYQPKTINDIQEMLKDLFADTIEDMLKAELDTELGYSKNSQNPKHDYSPRKIPAIHSRIPLVRGSVPGVRDRIPLTYISSILSPRERYLTFIACTSRIFSLPE